MQAQLVNVIFGMKVRRARMKANLTLTEMAARCEISPSYLTEVEKGRKYPRADKIMRMADELETTYDELVSITLPPALNYLESTLSSSLLLQFPFDAFGLEISDLVGLLTKAPDKASALLHAMIEIGRQHDLREEHILWAALRSYQELQDNYFPDIEDAAADFARATGLAAQAPVSRQALEELLVDEYGYTLDYTVLVDHPELRGYRSVYRNGTRPRLLLNRALSESQLKFLLARELGYQRLELTERATTSSPDRVESFQQVLNDFRASYFAGALLMPQARFLADLGEFFSEPTWQPARLEAMLTRYDLTPEMLLYRITELAPRFFGLKLHFLRVQGVHGSYKLVKRLNMNRLLMPSGLALDEHYCRRWLVMGLLRDLEAQQAQAPAGDGNVLHVAAQYSRFLVPRHDFLCFGFARPLALNPTVNSSAIVGFQVDDTAREVIRFLDDAAVPHETINETCERCPLAPEECTVRAAPPTVWEAREARSRRRTAIAALDEVPVRAKTPA